MISIIVPFYNEKENLPTLIKHLIEVSDNLEEDYEIVLVDDGSNDAGASQLKVKSEQLKIIKHNKRLGKGQALKTGIENSSGEIIVFMDADLQDDPEDLPKFLEKIDEGYDFVNGIRVGRQDGFLVKLYSNLAAKFLKLFLR